MSFTLNNIQYYIKKLGHGRYGSVFLLNDKHVAKISCDYWEDDLDEHPFTTSDEILEEIAIFKQIGYHPNIVKYYDSGIIPNSEMPKEMRNSYDEDVVVIIEEYVKGQPLLEMIKKNPDLFLEDMLTTAIYLENMNLVYADYSEDNIIFNGEHFILIDIGSIVDIDFIPDKYFMAINMLLKLFYKGLKNRNIIYCMCEFLDRETHEEISLDLNNVFEKLIHDGITKRLNLHQIYELI